MTDDERLAWIHDQPCICCEMESELRTLEMRVPLVIRQPNRTTAHHIVDNGYRRLSGGHQSTLPLCEWHHLGHRLRTHDFVDMEAAYGPSLARHKRKWNERYNGERYVLARVDAKLEQAA